MQSKIGMIAFLAAAALWTAPPSSGENGPAGYRREIRRKVLDNGLTIIACPDPKSSVVDVRAFVKNTGSIFEGKYLGCGISHYVEHLASGGSTSRRSEDEIRLLAESIGGVNNAYTTYDCTCYFVTTASRYLDTALDLVADSVRNCVFAQAEVDREREVILQEIKKDLDEPGGEHYRAFMETMFLVHFARYERIGYLDRFLTITRDDLVSFYRERYVPQNVVFVVAGDVNPSDAFAKVEKALGDWKMGPLTSVAIPAEPEQTSARRVEKEWKGLKTCSIIMGWPTVPLAHPDMYPLDMLSFILSQGKSSPLYRALCCGTPPLAQQAGSYSYTPWFGGSHFGIMIRGVDPASVDAAIEAAAAEIEKYRKNPVTPDELAKAQVQKRSQHVMALEKAEDLAEDAGSNAVGLGDPWYTEAYLRLLDGVTPAQISAAALKYLDRSRLTVAVLKPAAAEGRGPAGKGPDAAPAKPETARSTFPNGLRLLLRRTPGTGMISVQAWCKSGIMAETASNNGINRLMANLLLRGTKTRKAIDIDREVDSMGAELAASGGSHTFGVRMKILPDGFKQSMDLFADVLCNPSFEQEEIDIAKAHALAEIREEKSEWGSESMNIFRAAFFRKHPYRLNVLGSEESIPGITREDIAKFHRTFLHPANMVVAVFGDFDPAQAMEIVGASFGGLKSSESVPDLIPPSEDPLREDSTIHVKNDFNNMVVMVGWPAPSYKDGDRHVMTVIDALSSGAMYPGGRLYESLRGGEKGLVYYIHASNWPGMGTGAFYVMALTTPDNRAEVVSRILSQIEALSSSAVGEDELRIAKQVLITEHVVLNQAIEDQAQESSLNELYGFGYDFSEKYLQRIDAVTADDVIRVAKNYLRKRMVLTIGPEIPEGEKK